MASEDDFVIIEEVPSTGCAYDEWYETHWNKPSASAPLKVNVKNSETFVFLERGDITNTEIKEAYSAYFNVDHCMACKDRMMNMVRMIGTDGRPAFFSEPKETYPTQLHAIWDLSQRELQSTEGFQVKLVTEPHLWALTCGHNMASGEEYTHFNIWSSEFARVPIEIQFCVKYGFHKYFPLLMHMFSTHGVPGIKASLAASLALLDAKDDKDSYRVPYGDMIKSAFKWMQEYIVEDFGSRTPFEKVLLVTKAIFGGNIAPNKLQATNPTMTAYHQMNGNGLSVMACANDEDAFVAIMKDRFNPLAYQRPTADPTEGQVDNAIKLLGDFTNTLMTTKQALTEHGAVAYSPAAEVIAIAVSTDTATVNREYEHEQENTLSAFNAMKVAAGRKGGKGSTAADFASRMHKQMPDEITHPQTLKELLDAPGVQVEVLTERQMPAAAFTTTMGLDVIKHPFLWAFFPNQKPKDFGITRWSKVTSILPMGSEGGGGERHRNYLFVCENAMPIQNLPNCCFPANLQPEYARTCRSAYEKLNKVTSPSIPPSEEGPFAIGVGTSITGADGTLAGSLRVKVNGKEIILSKWE